MVKQVVQIQHAKYQSGADDPANDNEGYPNADSYDTPETRDTWGWYPMSSQMDPDADYNRRVIDHRAVLVPDPTVYTVRDQIVFPGDTVPWFVSEDIRDYASSPFSYRPGGEIVVEKITG